MGRKHINDGLTRWQRYRLKDVEAYRKRKREYAKTPKERAYRRNYMRVWRKEIISIISHGLKRMHRRQRIEKRDLPLIPLELLKGTG